MKAESILLQGLFDRLNKSGVCYAVLRNYTSLQESTAGSGLDILISPADEEKVRDILFGSIKHANGTAIGCSSTLGFFKVYAFGCVHDEDNLWWGLRIDVNVGYLFKGASIIKLDHLGEFLSILNNIQILKPDLASVLSLLKEGLNNNMMP